MTPLPSTCLYRLNSDASSITASRISGDACHMAVGSEDSSIQLWNLFPQTSSNQFSSEDNDRLDDNPVSNVGLACRRPDSPISDSHPSSNNICSSDQTLGRNNRLMRGHSGPVYGLAFIPGTNYLVSCGEDTTLRAWDYTTGVNKSLYRGHSYPIWSVDSDRLGLNIATGKLVIFIFALLLKV